MFIDVHMHVVRKKTLARNEAGDYFYATPEEQIQLMDKTGVDKGILSPYANPEAVTQYATVEDVLEICETYPDRFIPFCSVDPRAISNSPDANLSRHLAYYKERGCKGVGEVCPNLYFDDPLVMNLFKHCEMCEMPVLFHIAVKVGGAYGIADDLHLPRLEKCLQTFPGLIFIGHSQAYWSEIGGDVTEENRNRYPEGKIGPGGVVPRLLEQYPNMYAEISARSGLHALTRDPEFGHEFIDRFQDKLLFGTDTSSPTNDHRHAEVMRTLHSETHISTEAFEKISWQNANRILKLGL
jgi:hypothetical protein